MRLNYPSKPSLAKSLIPCSQESYGSSWQVDDTSVDRLKARSFGVPPSTGCQVLDGAGFHSPRALSDDIAEARTEPREMIERFISVVTTDLL